MGIAVLGEALVDLISGSDGKYSAHLGGSPYNVAIGLARQGVDVSYLSTLSVDNFGERLHHSLISEGVHLPLQRRSLWPTSLALVSLDEKKQASYSLYREGIADKDTAFDEVVANLPGELNVFHTGSLAITPSQLPKIRSLFSFMHEHGVLVSIDINIRLKGSIDTSKYLEGVLSLLSQVDIVKASDEDINALAIHSSLLSNADQIYKEMRGGLLVLTEGGNGATVYSEKGILRRPCYPVSTVADTVGAGDTFHAGFLAYLWQNEQLRGDVKEIDEEWLDGALNYASAAAAINVARSGCQPPTKKEVLEYIDTVS